MAKTFTGSWVVLILLIIICWPAGLIYFVMKYEEQPMMMVYAAPPQPYGAPPPQPGYPAAQPQPGYAAPPPPPQPGAGASAPCRYCGTPMVTGGVCPRCGAR